MLYCLSFLLARPSRNPDLFATSQVLALAQKVLPRLKLVCCVVVSKVNRAGHFNQSCFHLLVDQVEGGSLRLRDALADLGTWTRNQDLVCVVVLRAVLLLHPVYSFLDVLNDYLHLLNAFFIGTLLLLHFPLALPASIATIHVALQLIAETLWPLNNALSRHHTAKAVVSHQLLRSDVFGW